MFGPKTRLSKARNSFAVCVSVVLMLFAFSATAQSSPDSKARQLDAQTQYEMGSRYRLGLGVNANPKLALEWFTKAANQGSAKGQYAVAWMIAFSDDKDARDYVAALPWLLKASELESKPNETGYSDTKKRAEKKLRWMCKKGVVEFPNFHPMSEDPKCLLARGNRLFYGRDKLGELVGGRNYHVERDYVRARTFLEKALKAGEKGAAINLAKVYQKGLGTEENPEKFEYYLKLSGETNDGETNIFLAERAQKSGDIKEYLRRLEIAATDSHPRAARKLGQIYLKGDIAQKDSEMALMYLLLGGERNYAKSEHKGHITPKAEMVAVFQPDSAAATLDAAKVRADDFAKTHKFRSYRKKDIEQSYARAVRDLNWVKDTNGVVPFKNTFFGSLLNMLFMPLLILSPLILIRRFVGSRN